MGQAQLARPLVVQPDTDNSACAGGEDEAGVGADTGEHLAHQVAGLADEDGPVRVVVAEAEALVSKAPG